MVKQQQEGISPDKKKSSQSNRLQGNCETMQAGQLVIRFLVEQNAVLGLKGIKEQHRNTESGPSWARDKGLCRLQS